VVVVQTNDGTELGRLEKMTRKSETEGAAPAGRPAAAAPDLERREHEREGGGAPSERAASNHESLFGRLWHLL